MSVPASPRTLADKKAARCGSRDAASFRELVPWPNSSVDDMASASSRPPGFGRAPCSRRTRRAPAGPRRIAEAFCDARAHLGVQLRIAAGSQQLSASGAMASSASGEAQDFSAGAARTSTTCGYTKLEGLGRARARCARRAVAAPLTLLARFWVEQARAAQKAVEVDIAPDSVGEPVDQRCEIGTALLLDEAKMPLRQGERRCRGQRAEHRNSRCGDCIGNERAMALAGDAIENDAAMRTAGSWVAKPRISAAPIELARATSSTSTTGSPKCAARSAVRCRAAAHCRPPRRRTISIRLQSRRYRRRRQPRFAGDLANFRRHRPAIEIDAQRAVAAV